MSFEAAQFRTLILSNDIITKKFLKELLEGEGYNLQSCNSPDKVIETLIKGEFELFLVDFDDGQALEVCKSIRANFILRHIPVIVIVSQKHTIEKIKCIYAGADDYLEKPLNAGEVLTRLIANFWRSKRDLDANPLTKLPGNVTIIKEVEKRIRNKDAFCLAYADLDKFKEYNDYYGFEWGDKVIEYTARTISQALIDLGSPDDFLGHIGGDDFIFITEFESLKEVCEKIIDDFDRNISTFYKPEDLKRGYIIVKNREGKITASSILNISIGVANNKRGSITHVGQIIQIASELKAYAKTFSKSIYTVERRK